MPACGLGISWSACCWTVRPWCPTVCCDLSSRCVEPACPPATDCFDLIPYSDYLEQQNRRGVDCPIAFSDYLESQNRRAHERPPEPKPWPTVDTRPQAPRIGDVPPMPESPVARKLQAAYQPDPARRAGRFIDVFV